MVKNDKAITVEQGNVLFASAAGKFALPEKLGTNSYDLGVRTAAEDEVRTLFNELKGLCPQYVKDRSLLFGPSDCWEPVRQSTERGDVTGHILKDPGRTVRIRISEDARNGAFWILLLLVHPESPRKLPIASQVDTLWPLAETLRLTTVLRREIGLASPQHRRLELDPEPDGKVDGVAAVPEEAKA